MKNHSSSKRPEDHYHTTKRNRTYRSAQAIGLIVAICFNAGCEQSMGPSADATVIELRNRGDETQLHASLSRKQTEQLFANMSSAASELERQIKSLNVAQANATLQRFDSLIASAQATTLDVQGHLKDLDAKSIASTIHKLESVSTRLDAISNSVGDHDLPSVLDDYKQLAEESRATIKGYASTASITRIESILTRLDLFLSILISTFLAAATCGIIWIGTKMRLFIRRRKVAANTLNGAKTNLKVFNCYTSEMPVELQKKAERIGDILD